MAGFVLDASIPVAATLPDESAAAAAAALIERAETEGAAVPAIWATELANALLAAARRRRIAVEDVAEALTTLGRLPVEVATTDLVGIGGGALRIAIRHRLSVYDATYLDLALRLGLPLASFDGALRKAAAAEGVRTLPE